ncbi:MAG: alpha/beta hydrolase [Lautropia sp.]|nr:alpha/beta hydrolase [Lautropia sp.]
MPHRLPLVFVHGNGIPRPVYQKMLIGLSHRFIATGVDRLGHDPQYPVTEAWPRLLDQLRNHISAVGEPVTLLGHGSGGWLSLLAAYRVPELVSTVILLDAPLPTVAQARLLNLLKHLGVGDMPGRLFSAGPDIEALDPECQSLYRRFGCRPSDALDGSASVAEPRRFDAAVSRRIHQTYPLGLAALVARGAPVDGSGRVVSCGMLVGERSRAARVCGLAASRSLTGKNLVRIEGSHLFPLERPLVTAKEIVRLHDRMVGLDAVYGNATARHAAPAQSKAMQAFG